MKGLFSFADQGYQDLEGGLGKRSARIPDTEMLRQAELR